MMERKASRPGMSRLNSDGGKSGVLPIEGEAENLEMQTRFHSTCWDRNDHVSRVSTEFPAPKNELFQRFHVYYLGSEPVAKPVGKNPLSDTHTHTHIQ